MFHHERARRAVTASVLTGAVVLVTGCLTVGPDYEQPETTVPDVWHTEAVAGLAAGEADLERWWSVLDDPQLDDLIVRAKAANLDIRTAVWRVEEARALRGVAAGIAYPQVEASGAASRAEPSDNGPLGELAPDGFDAGNLFELGVGASWEIDVFGRIRRTVESADAALEADVEAYRDVLVSLLAEVASAYVDLRTTQDRLRLARNNVDIQDNTLSLTQDRFRIGLVSGLDVAQAEAILASTEALIPQLRTQRELAMNRLAVLLGSVPGSLHDELLEARPVPHEPQQATVGLPADLLRQRPDVRRAERLLAAQTARIGIATADLYPSFSLTGYLGLESVDGGDLFDSGSTVWSLGLPVRWAIFSGGRIRSQIRAEEARTEQALAVYEQTVLRALEEVENSLYAYGEELSRRDHLRDTVDATERSLDLVMTQYRSGLTNFQNVLDTQRSLLTRQDELAASEGQVTQNLIGLYRALGGGWDPEEVPAAPVESDDRAADRAGSGDETPGSA
jgi:NodT family efflux transporter outer membrane factor (OMF) lipoprotein